MLLCGRGLGEGNYDAAATQTFQSKFQLHSLYRRQSTRRECLQILDTQPLAARPIPKFKVQNHEIRFCRIMFAVRPPPTTPHNTLSRSFNSLINFNIRFCHSVLSDLFCPRCLINFTHHPTPSRSCPVPPFAGDGIALPGAGARGAGTTNPLHDVPVRGVRLCGPRGAPEARPGEAQGVGTMRHRWLGMGHLVTTLPK